MIGVLAPADASVLGIVRCVRDSESDAESVVLATFRVACARGALFPGLGLIEEGKQVPVGAAVDRDLSEVAAAH